MRSKFEVNLCRSSRNRFAIGLLWAIALPVGAGAQEWQVSLDGGLDALADGAFGVAVTRLSAAFEASEADPTVQVAILGYLVDAQVGAGDMAVVRSLWDYLDRGHAPAVLQQTLRALEGDSFDTNHDAFLPLVAASLSRQFYDPATFEDSLVDILLREIERTSPDSVGIRELRSWHDPGVFAGALVHPDSGCADAYLEGLRTSSEPEGWSWWGQVDATDGEAIATSPQELSRSDAGRELLGMLGAWYGEDNQPTQSLAYLCVAALLDHDSVRPGPLRNLVWAYIDRGQRGLVEDLDDRLDDHFHGVDGDYLEPIVDRFAFHHWYWPALFAHNQGKVAIAAVALCVWLCPNPWDDPKVTVVVQVP